MRLILDEHLDRAIAEEFRTRGHDVLAITESDDLKGLTDPQILAWAGGVGRVIVTYNVRHFGPLSEEHQAVGEPFAGVIFLSQGRYPQGPRSSGRIVRDLASLMDALPARDALSDTSIWLTGED